MGVDGCIIDVEVDSASGLPGFDIVGLPDASVKESKERVRTAIRNSGIQLRQEKVTINLAPADIRKDSSGLDLPIAIGLLAAYGVIPNESLGRSLFAAELSLEGECRGIRGVLPMIITAQEKGFSTCFVARENAAEALLVDGITVYALEDLNQLVQFLTGQAPMNPAVSASIMAITCGIISTTFTFNPRFTNASTISKPINPPPTTTAVFGCLSFR